MTELQAISTLDLSSLNRKFLASKTFGVVEIRLSEEDGLWRDLDGVIFALRREGGAIDPIDQCGIAPFAIPVWAVPDSINAACRVHDFMYESPAYQAFHTRSEADEYLAYLAGQSSGFWSVLKHPFKWLSRQFGKRAWENQSTND